jgi:micrococcal nuclease
MDLLDNLVFDLPLYTINNVKCQGRIVDVYDGDTITIVFQLGNQLQKHKIRLYGINTPELKGATHKKGVEARNFLLSKILGRELDLDKEYKRSEVVDMLKLCKRLFMFELLGEEKYGRVLGKIYNGDECLNDILVLYGYAKEYIL